VGSGKCALPEIFSWRALASASYVRRTLDERQSFVRLAPDERQSKRLIFVLCTIAPLVRDGAESVSAIPTPFDGAGAPPRRRQAPSTQLPRFACAAGSLRRGLPALAPVSPTGRVWFFRTKPVVHETSTSNDIAGLGIQIATRATRPNAVERGQPMAAKDFRQMWRTARHLCGEIPQPVLHFSLFDPALTRATGH
jgi:hypothetical protein